MSKNEMPTLWASKTPASISREVSANMYSVVPIKQIGSIVATKLWREKCTARNTLNSATEANRPRRS